MIDPNVPELPETSARDELVAVDEVHRWSGVDLGRGVDRTIRLVLSTVPLDPAGDLANGRPTAADLHRETRAYDQGLAETLRLRANR